MWWRKTYQNTLETQNNLHFLMAKLQKVCGHGWCSKSHLSMYRGWVLATNCFASLFLLQPKKRLCWCRMSKSGLTDKNHSLDSLFVCFFFSGSWKSWLGWLLWLQPWRTVLPMAIVYCYTVGGTMRHIHKQFKRFLRWEFSPFYLNGTSYAKLH